MGTTAAPIYYVVRANLAAKFAGCDRDVIYGYEPVLYRTKSAADAHAETLATSGDWGGEKDGDGAPDYYVEAVTADDLFPAERADFADGKIGR